jgi:hypothetical protein
MDQRKNFVLYGTSSTSPIFVTSWKAIQDDLKKKFLNIRSQPKVVIQTGGFVTIFNALYSTLLHLPPLRYNCVGGMLGSNPGLLRLWHGQSHALTIRLDLVSKRLKISPVVIHIVLYNVQSLPICSHIFERRGTGRGRVLVCVVLHLIGAITI